MNEEIQNLIQAGREAIDLADSVDAYKVLTKLRELVKAQSSNPVFSLTDFQRLMLQLKIVAFSSLPDKETCEVLSNYYLQLYSMGVPIEERLIAKLFYVPYLVRDELRKELKTALLQNQQKIGQLGIGQWIAEFEKMFKGKNRDLSSTIKFVLEHPESKILSSADQKKLKELLHVYDYCLVATLPATGKGLMNLLNSMPDGNATETFVAHTATQQQRFSSGSTYQKQYSEAAIFESLVQMALVEALQKYPKVGEQHIGSEQIKLRYFPTPVRPSIKNWITDFHDGMGAGKHSPIDRGNFLFHSENGKRLNSADRQKLGIILRSLDEQTLLNIDGDAQVIIFENAENTQNESSVNAEKQGQVMHSNLDSRLRGNDNASNRNDNVGQSQIHRDAAQTVDLRRNQIQQERNTHDVFGDLAPTPKNENIQDKKLNNKVQDFFAKPAIEKMQNIGNAPSSAHDYMGTFSQREKGESKKTSEPDNYFSIPQSKPPIGSEEFHVASTNDSLIESGLKIDQLNAVEVPKSGKILDRDSMSDEDLFNMLREKKIKQDVTKLNSSVGNFKFSSPQKLPAEQEKKPVQKMVQQPLRQQAAPPKQNNFSIKPSSQIKKSPYHISPSDYEYGKKTEASNEATPKIQKNIVDLKNYNYEYYRNS